MKEEKRAGQLVDIGIREIIALSGICNETRESLRRLEERVKKLENRLDAMVAVVEEIVYARWCEGKKIEGAEKRALAGSLGLKCTPGCTPNHIYDRLFEGRKGEE